MAINARLVMLSLLFMMMISLVVEAVGVSSVGSKNTAQTSLLDKIGISLICSFIFFLFRLLYILLDQ